MRNVSESCLDPCLFLPVCICREDKQWSQDRSLILKVKVALQKCHCRKISTNHVFGKAIQDTLPECIFENFEIARLKREQFQNYQGSRGWFIPKIARTKHMVTA